LQFGSLLGKGAAGSVYHGKHLGRDVAIKRLHPSAEPATARQLEDFHKEVFNLMSLRHDRLVSFIGAAYQEPCMCIVTEFMPNGSLYHLLHEKRQMLSIAQRTSLSVQCAEGTEFLHTREPPFVHRDLKSLNVVLDFGLNAKLCDFGFTECMEKTHISRREKERLGSPRYTAPELLDSHGKITEKVDIWALGCLVMEIFTGRVPHEDCNTFQQLVAKILVRREAPYHDLPSRRLSHVADCCFNFDPLYRASVATVLGALRGMDQGVRGARGDDDGRLALGAQERRTVT
jgi:serine/threonine protein kinase